MRRCHRCGEEWVSEKWEPGVKESCEHCSAYLHSCKNCRFHDPHAHNQCVSSTAEWVSDKETGNFCGEFEFAKTDDGGAPPGEEDQARDAFGALFGDDDSTPKKNVDDLKRLFDE